MNERLTHQSLFLWARVERHMQNLYYNTPGGKLNRGLSVVDTYALLAGKQDGSLSDEEYFKAAVLGWCIELVRLYLLPARLGCLSLKADFFLHVPSPPLSADCSNSAN
jgi:geranylgeranyl pyrophosphate synthase